MLSYVGKALFWNDIVHKLLDYTSNLTPMQSIKKESFDSFIKDTIYKRPVDIKKLEYIYKSIKNGAISVGIRT